MHGEPTPMPIATWLHQAIQYHCLLLIIFIFCQDYNDHHFFSMLVVKYKERRIAITNYDLLFELAKFYNYEGCS
jgi:hypothetical protein